jgi:beta-glucosidase
VLVLGEAANDIGRQVGGWSLSWQGDDNKTSDFRTGETLLDALRDELGVTHVTYAASGTLPDLSDFDIVIAVVAERAYAEYSGDVAFPEPLSLSALYPDQMELVANASGHGIPVVTVLYSGRNLYATDILNASDAFVAAYLPGSEVHGLVDLLVQPALDMAQFDFSGRLPSAWPSDPCESTGRNALFPRGYGLSYADELDMGILPMPAPVRACESPE